MYSFCCSSAHATTYSLVVSVDSLMVPGAGVGGLTLTIVSLPKDGLDCRAFLSSQTIHLQLNISSPSILCRLTLRAHMCAERSIHKGILEWMITFYKPSKETGNN